MAQNYLWKVECGHYYYSSSNCYADWWYESKVFTNKMSALKYMNKLQNSGNYRNVRMKKWFG
jgi:hypothetical protein